MMSRLRGALPVGLLLLSACDTDPASVIGGMDGGRPRVDSGPRPDAPPIIIPGDDGGTVGRSDGGGIAIGGWRERILDADGNIDWEEWEYVANHYNEEEIVDYRFGPTAVDFGFPTNEDPELYGPAPEDGLWRSGADAALAERLCVTSDRLPRSEAEERAYADQVLNFQMSGQLLFSPDTTHPDYTSDFAAGCANAVNADGAVAIVGGASRALCMRLRPAWYPDWWNRNNINAPTSVGVLRLLEARPDVPLPPVATARGGRETSVTGFLIFRDGTVSVAGTGNDGYEFSGGTSGPVTRLPDGFVPTAVATTPGNEFAFITVWDVPNRRAGLAVVAAGVVTAPATVPGGFGVHSWPSIERLKYLGFIELPFAAPVSVSVTHDVPMDNLRGTAVVEEGALLDTQAQRDVYREWTGEGHRAIARSGYALVGSRAENRVALIDLQPLFAFYRDMYLTTQENWDATRPDRQGPGDREWPYTFVGETSQVPTVLAVLDVPQPTSVYAATRVTGFFSRTGTGNGEGAGYGYIGSLDGTIRRYDFRALVGLPGPTPTAATPTLTRIGPNPTCITSPINIAGGADDIVIVSRGGRAIHTFDYAFTDLAVLRDRRLLDPVWVGAGFAQAGFGGAGPEAAVATRVLTVIDRDGRQVVDYGFRYERDGDAARPEQWRPFEDASGTPVPFLYGWSAPLPGRPFMYSFDEVI